MPIIFKSAKETKNPYFINVATALKRIREGVSKDIVQEVRNIESLIKEETNAEQRRVLTKNKAAIKINLPSVVFAANKVEEFTKKNSKGEDTTSFRFDESVTVHSGFAIFDVDNLESPEEFRDNLKENKYIYSAWISPSGDGVNFLVKFYNSVEEHPRLYESFIQKHIDLDLDTTSRNISRIKFESYDPSIWVNEESEVWDVIIKEKPKEVKENKVVHTLVKDWSKVNLALSKIASSHDGEKMKILLKISNLFGGWVAQGDIDSITAENLLKTEILKKDINDEDVAFKAISDALHHGMQFPIAMYEERDILNMRVGSDKMYFSLPEKAKELHSFHEYGYGTGAKLGWLGSREFVSFVDGGTTYIYGSPSAGKSIFAFEMLIDFAINYGKKTALMSPEEGSAGEIFGTLVSIYMGKPIIGKYKMTDEELEIGSKFIQDYFYVIEPKTASINLEDFFAQVEGIERTFDVKIDYTFLDPMTYISHQYPQGVTREDLAINETLKLNLLVAKQTNRHHFIAIHIRDMQMQKNEEGQMYFPFPTARDLAGGQMFYRAGFNMLALWRPLDVKNNPLVGSDGVPHRENELIVFIQKFKPRGSGKLGSFSLFFDLGRNQFYELIDGERRYSPKVNGAMEEVKTVAALEPNLNFFTKTDDEPPF
jgi:hypothetical protein